MYLFAFLVLIGTLAITTDAPAMNVEAPHESATHVLNVDYHCKFERQQWNTSDWIMIKRPAFARLGDWIQNDDHIANQTPAQATNDEMQGTKASETYTGMVLKQIITGSATISATMSFDYKMAPSIVIAGPLGESKDGKPEFRRLTEVVLFDQGVNIWVHEYINGSSKWTKLAWSTFAIEPRKKHELHIAISGQKLEITVEGHAIGVTDSGLPNAYSVGIAGNEGINRFYAFSVKS